MNFIRSCIILFFLMQHSFSFASEINAQNNNQCSESFEKNHLLSGWYLWEPYQFNKLEQGVYKLTGMDVQFMYALAKRVGVEVKYEPVSWGEHQADLRDGNRDIAAGATYTKDRAKYVYFSIPYRFEENSLFVLRDSGKNLDFNSVSEFLSQVRLKNFNLGVGKDFVYADPEINLFVSDNINQDIIYEYKDEVEALNALEKGEIDGFVSDRMVGASVVLNYNKKRSVKEIRLNAKTPIHFIFSKKTVPLELVDKFNQEIRTFSKEDEYKNIVKTYLYPVMLLQTIDSNWFYLIGVIGTFAFAISGVAIAAKDNATLFGTFLFAMLPSVGGGIMRDVLVQRNEIILFLTPSYIYYIIMVVLIGFSAVRLLEYYNKRASEDELMKKFWDHILIIGDAAGQAAFIVTGVSVVIMARIEPIELWGPFFAFLAANGGGILRDILRKKHHITCLSGTFNAEVSILWGLIFSIYLDINSYNPDPIEIKNTVIVVAIGAFITRLLAHYFNIQNIRFKKEVIRD